MISNVVCGKFWFEFSRGFEIGDVIRFEREFNEEIRMVISICHDLFG